MKRFQIASNVANVSPLTLDKMRADMKLPNVIGLSLGEPDIPTPNHVIEAAIDALRRGYTHYTPSVGYLDLREAIAGKLKKENEIEVNPETEIIVTAGAGHAIDLVMRSILEPGDEVIVTDPGYHHYAYNVKFLGAEPVSVGLYEDTDFTIRAEEISKKLTPKTKLLILNSPSNPTGTVIDKNTLAEIAEIAKSHDLLVLSDEIYEKTTYDDAKHYSIASLSEMKERTITINGFSKAYAMTGLRVGYVTACEKIISNVLKLQTYTNICASSVSQRAALAALTGPQNFVESMVKEYDRRRKLIVNGLNKIEGISCKTPKGAFYAFASVKALGMSSEEAYNFLVKKARVITLWGTLFGNNGEGYLRLSYANSYENIQIALQRIAEACMSLK